MTVGDSSCQHAAPLAPYGRDALRLLPPHPFNPCPLRTHILSVEDFDSLTLCIHGSRGKGRRVCVGAGCPKVVRVFQSFVALCLNDFPVWTHSSAFNGKAYIVLNKGRAGLLNKLFVQVAPMLSALASGGGSKYLYLFMLMDLVTLCSELCSNRGLYVHLSFDHC